jgi:hypothetical protein
MSTPAGLVTLKLLTARFAVGCLGVDRDATAYRGDWGRLRPPFHNDRSRLARAGKSAMPDYVDVVLDRVAEQVRREGSGNARFRPPPGYQDPWSRKR